MVATVAGALLLLLLLLLLPLEGARTCARDVPQLRPGRSLLDRNAGGVAVCCCCMLLLIVTFLQAAADAIQVVVVLYVMCAHQA
jgi:hypothetical protein